jgi:hypothetical protein
MNTDDNRQEAIELTTTDQPITPDPLFKVAAIFETPQEASAAVDELKSSGFVEKDIEYYCGEPGVDNFDFSGSNQGLMARLVRTFRNSTYDRVILDRYEAALRTGNCLVMVHIHKTEQKNDVAKIFHHYKAHQVDYFGLAMTEHISEATSEQSTHKPTRF